MEEKTTASDVRPWYSLYIHSLDSIFLQQLQSPIQLFNVFSSSCCFTQGLPQGSILVPFLFLFYFNNLASLLDDNAAMAVFTDDVSILTTACKKEDAEAAAQSMVNSVLIWKQKWKLNFNIDKSEVCHFSTWSNNSTWHPAVFTGTQKI